MLSRSVWLLATPWTVARQAPLFMGILQARILEWVAMPSSRRSSQPNESNPGLPHCRWLLYCLSHRGSPVVSIFLPYPNYHVRTDSSNVPDAGKDWGQKEKRALEDEMPGWHHWCNGQEFGQILGDSEGQRGLACCRPWSNKESNVTGWLNNNNCHVVGVLQYVAFLDWLLSLSNIHFNFLHVFS